MKFLNSLGSGEKKSATSQFDLTASAVAVINIKLGDSDSMNSAGNIESKTVEKKTAKKIAKKKFQK